MLWHNKASSKPEWSSMLLALSFDVAVAMGPHAHLHVPDTVPPNVLQLHRAVSQPAWPTHFPDGSPLPTPAVLGAAEQFGTRICIREAYRRIRAEMPLARAERVSKEGSCCRSKGVIITGNAGCGKTFYALFEMHQRIHQPHAHGHPRHHIIYHNAAHNIMVRIRGAHPSTRTVAGETLTVTPRLTLGDIEYAASLDSFKEELRCPTTLYILDPGVIGANLPLPSSTCRAEIQCVLPPDWCQAQVMVHFKERVAFLQTRFLPCLDAHEIELCRRVTCPTQEEVEEDKVNLNSMWQLDGHLRTGIMWQSDSHDTAAFHNIYSMQPMMSSHVTCMPHSIHAHSSP